MCYLGWSQLFFQGRGEGDGDPIAQVYLVCEQQYVFSVHCCQNAVDTSPAQGDLSSKLCPIPAFALRPISSVSLRFHTLRMSSAFPGGSVAKNSPANVGATGDSGSIPGSGRFPGGRNGNLLHYSCLENPMDRGTWWATVHRVRQRVGHDWSDLAGT